MAKNQQKIKGIPEDKDKLLVQKSNPLYSLWKSKLTLAEFKILDVYLSRIDSRHPEKRTVIFEKGEIEKLLGITQIKRDDLDKRLEHLMGNVVKVDDPTTKRGIRIVTLFEEVAAYPDDNGVWTVMLECTQKAMQYFFNVEKLGYLRYRLRSITSLTSRYSYILFCYLEKNRFRKAWEIALDALKELLGCQNEETYRQYKYFNNLILRKCHKEITEKTQCKYAYTPIKSGRRVVKIKFVVETLPDMDPAEDDKQITIEQIQEKLTDREIYAQACDGFFRNAELDELIAAVEALPESKLPQGDVLVQRRANYLRMQYKKMLRYAQKHKVWEQAAYLAKMISKDACAKDPDPEKPQKPKNSFMNFDQREYDFAELEKSLVRKQMGEKDC